MRRACSTGLLALELTALPWLVASLLAIPGAGPGARDGRSLSASQSRSPSAPPAAAAAIATPFASAERAVAVRFEAEAPTAVSFSDVPGWLDGRIDGGWGGEPRLPRRRARVAAAPEPAPAALLALAAGLWAGLRRIRHRRTGGRRS